MKKIIRNLLVAAGWAMAIVLITLNVLYLRNDPSRYAAPWEIAFNDLDLLLLLCTSVIAGMFLTDLDTVFWGYAGSLAFAFAALLIFSFLFSWFVLGSEEVFSQYDFGWEWVLWWGFGRIIRVMFPVPIMLCFFGGFVGCILGDYFKTDILPFFKDVLRSMPS